VRAWIVAARPATLLASVAPVLVGSGLAAADGVLRWDALAAALGAAVLINIAANLANDASDAARGTDTTDRIGPRRVVATGLLTARQVWVGTAILVVLAAGLAVYLASISDWFVIGGLGLISVAAMVGYSGGPWPYGYHGLGEVSVFVFFGLVAVVGSRFVHDATAPVDAWLLAIPVGLLVTAILVANNIRDIDTDRATGKTTLAVILGRSGTRALFTTMILGAFGAIGVFALLDLVPTGSLVALAAIPLAVPPIRIVGRASDGPSLIAALQATARLHLATGVLLAIGVQL